MESGSIFQKAFHEYVSSLPEKKKTRKRKFIVDCTATRDGRPTTPETINEALRQAEIQNADKPGRKMIKKVMGPIVNALRDYDGIINSLASADPMPTAIIWGALKVILDGAHRFFNLFDTIKKELRVLQVQIQRISEYETLYGDSAMLQDLLCRSYINMFRFWSRVDKECESYWYMGMLKAATSFSTKKLDSIIKDIEENADQIEELASILEANKGKGEREAADIERFRQGMERAAAQKERDAAAAERGENQVVRQEERYRRICEWLCARQGNEDNMRHLRLLTSHHMQGTCEWLLQHQTYIDWCAGTASPVLWIYAPPAAGKSVLSSHIIHATSRSDGDAIVVYHFYRFDQMHTASETLRILAGQLFDAYWARNHTVSDDMFSKAQQSVCSTENVQELIKLLVRDLPKTYFILDGVDEECTSVTRWLEATTTLQFLLKLTVDVPGRMRVWYSSQPRQLIYDLLKAACTMIDAQSHAEADIARYLCHDNPELRDLEVSDADKDHVLASLQSRAKANFLWASRMLWSLKKRDSLTDMKQFVAEGLPKTLDEYYGRIFDNFDRSHRERSLISKVFALVVFARRPLRLGEVREAVGLLLSKNPRSLVADDMPFVSRLRTLLPPLIEFQEDGCSDPDDCTCRLFHSTVREFLVKNPHVLQAGLSDGPVDEVLIAPKVIANACLRYLCQERYSRPLRKHDIRWVDAAGDPVDRHRFLLYSAKYWDKHLDDSSFSQELSSPVRSFILSPNFHTCVQAQSLWVDSQFGVFCYPAHADSRVYLRRMFPAWFVAQTPAGRKLWFDFRAFIHEWKYFLHSPTSTCNTSMSSTLPSSYVGELDRCWWPTLGPQNFLSKFKCKYTTFTFEKDGFATAGWYYCEGVSTDGLELVALTLISSSRGSLTFGCNYWSLSANNRPKLLKSQAITTTDELTNWRIYVKLREDVKSNAGRPPPIAFSPCNGFLRIGTQLFMRNTNDEYEPMRGFDALSTSQLPEIEEFAVRGNIVAIASRRRAPPMVRYSSGLLDETIEFIGFDLLRIEGAPRPSWIDSRSKHSHDDGDSETDSDSQSDGEAYETWSEGSTELSEGLEDDIITPWVGPLSDMSDSDSDSSDSSESSAVDSLKGDEEKEESQTSVDSDDSESDVEPAALLGYGRWHKDEDDYRWSDSDSDSDVEEIRNSNVPESVATIEILSKSDDTDVPVRLFRFSKDLPFQLYASPPVIHPTKNLLVWPLSAGDVLFADFVSKTYFIRKLRSSTQHTRQVFMKCFFSPCGSYIHFACLEGQKKPVSRRQKKLGGKDTFNLALLVSTYRLSSRKTTRSPPSLIHRSRLNLGSQSKLSISNLPYTLTWTATHLYFTQSNHILLVKRISLFPEDKDKGIARQSSVTVPRKPILLPESAARRAVHFFPARGTEDDDRAIVILGSESRTDDSDLHSARIDDQLPGKQKKTSIYSIKDTLGLRSSPIGCYLRETSDFGGWGKCQDVSKLPNDMGIGKLDRQLEKFDPEDDCDLEPYFR